MLKVLTLEERIKELETSSRKNMADLGKGSFVFAIIAIVGMILIGGSKSWLLECDGACSDQRGWLSAPGNNNSETVSPWPRERPNIDQSGPSIRRTR